MGINFLQYEGNDYLMKVGIIADDITGANATGVKFSQKGFITSTYFNRSNITSHKFNEIICIDTDSRYETSENSKELVENALKKLQTWGADLICKRIDSTFRGNVGQELEALMLNLGNDTLSIIVASLPSAKRVVSDGKLIVNGIPLQETDVAKDPIRPLKESSIPNILSKQTRLPIHLVTLDKVTLGSRVIEDEIKACINKNARIIVCDATTDSHIKSIAEATKNIKNKKVIPVDPGPFSHYYVEQMRGGKSAEKKILVSVGSVTSVTKRQLQFLIKKTNATPIYIKPERLATTNETWDKEVERSVKRAINVLERESLIIITTNHPDSKNIDLKCRSEKLGVSEVILAKRINSGIAEISRQIIKYSRGGIIGCFFSGGDLTGLFCEVIHADGIDLYDEVMPMVAYGKICGGDYSGLPIITKGGMVGEKNSIYESIEYMKTL